VSDENDDLVADAVPLIRLARPAWEAIVRRRPWIVATGRRAARTALDEIADALERGEPRLQPFWAHWTGYDRGGLRLARKLGG
jgi:hypothetical protein